MSYDPALTQALVYMIVHMFIAFQLIKPMLNYYQLTIFNGSSIKKDIHIHSKNQFENIMCKMVNILYYPSMCKYQENNR